MKLSKQALQQTYVIGGLTLCSISDGFIFGQMSGMIDALRDPSNSMKLTDNDISTIAATINVTCFCGFAVMVGLTEVFGRRKSLTILSLPVILCWLMVYFAQDKMVLIASRAIVGLSYGGIIVMSYINVGEYMAPGKRSFWLNFMYGIGSAFGTMAGHVMCLFIHWRNVALVGLIPTTLSAMMPLFWVESPSWLATKKRFDECEKAFYTLHARNVDTEKELKMLIEFQKKNNKLPNNFRTTFKKFFEACKHMYYLKVVILLTVVCVYRVAAGRVLLSTLAITIMKDITGNNDIFAYTLMVDGFSLIGSGLSCILVAKFNMRPLLLSSGVVSNIIQVLLATSLYLCRGEQWAWLNISLLALYYVTIIAGPYSVLETLLAELHPLQIKTINCVLLGAISSVSQFTNIQLATKMFSSIGYHGVFYLNSGVVFLCLFYIYMMCPETKGRTLLEIEYYMEHKTFAVNDNLNNLREENVRLNQTCDSVDIRE